MSKQHNTLIENLNTAVRYHTAFESFKHLVLDSCFYSYRPTLYVNAAKSAKDRSSLRFIARYYDRAMVCMKSDKRAYRV